FTLFPYTTLFRSGVSGNCGFNGDGIPATTAFLNGPYGVAVDARGSLYLGDYGNNRVRKVNRSGIISTIAGNGTCGFSGDGGLGTGDIVWPPDGGTVDTKRYV